MAAGSVVVTYLYLLLYIFLSTGVILFNKWILSPKHGNFPFPIALTMIHMGFSGSAAFVLIRLFKIVEGVKMSTHIYVTCVLPISAFFAGSLWLGNTAYLHISVAFIQMLKSLMPVATYITGILLYTDSPRLDLFANMIWVSAGVAVASYGEIHFNLVGTAFQVAGNFCEALRLVLTQVLLQRRGLQLNAITSLYYIAPCSFLFLSIPWFILEKSAMEVATLNIDYPIFLANGLCALALNLAIFVVIGRTGALTYRIAGILKDWVLILLSTSLFPETQLTGVTIGGYAIALLGVVYYNRIRSIEARTAARLLPVSKVAPSRP